MFQDRKSYLRDVSHNLSVCRNKLDSILNSIGWSYHSLQTKALEDLRSSDPAQGSSKCDQLNHETTELIQTSRFYVLPRICYLLTNWPMKCQNVENPSMYTELVQSIAETSSLKNRKKEDKELLVEMLALERDAKRRRTSYKSKVHTKNKSYSEILKEVIGQQMEMLEGSEKKETPLEKVEDKTRLIELKKHNSSDNPYLLWQTLTPEEVEGTKKIKRKRSRERHKSRSRSREHHRSRSRERHRSTSRSRDKKRKRRSKSKHKHSKKQK